MAELDPNALVTFTYDASTQTYSVTPSSQNVSIGDPIKLVVVNQDSILVRAVLPDGSAYFPLEYEATKEGREYALQSVLDTFCLQVSNPEKPSPSSTIVPVVPMSLSDIEFVPKSIVVRQENKILIRWTGTERSIVVRTYGERDNALPLFGGTRNEYEVLSTGSLFTIAAVDSGTYQIECDCDANDGDHSRPVRGTVNVTVRR
ncbi:MAG TPA: hypothetical protein VN253_02110 [Kofleriaceae bacterium]|nr:hypothetical protein [Kofleriaceae bacterium]